MTAAEALLGVFGFGTLTMGVVAVVLPLMEPATVECSQPDTTVEGAAVELLQRAIVADVPHGGPQPIREVVRLEEGEAGESRTVMIECTWSYDGPRREVE